MKFRSDKLRSDTPSVSSIYIHGESITNLSSDKHRIPRQNNKKRKIQNL